MPNLKFTATYAEARLIDAIIDRALRDWPSQDRGELDFCLTVCHCNGCPLKLVELLTSAQDDFCHDVWGIHSHISLSSGRLKDCFLPRYAQPKKGD